ncbi:MAG: HEAT repeat domain-containing protein [Chlamydiia bacterium]|nr:HEAT repeat domain-containing protein [Chlamydiia bacterium]
MRQFLAIISLLILSSLPSDLCAYHGSMRYLQQGRYGQLLGHYQQKKIQNEKMDFDELRQIGFQILREGIESDDRDIQLLTLLSATIACVDEMKGILHAGANSIYPEIQLATLQISQSYPSNLSVEIATKFLSSPHPLLYLEALLLLAKRQHPMALGHLETLLAKIPPQIKPLFPQFFAALGTPQAIRHLKRMLSDPSETVRIATILTAAENRRDDLLPKIRQLAKHPSQLQQEACSKALGDFLDASSKPLLQKLSSSSIEPVRLTALRGLYLMGDEGAERALEAAADGGNLYAITALSKRAGSEDFLFKLTRHPDRSVRINAALGLLERCDDRCAEGILELLLPHGPERVLVNLHTPSKGLSAWREVSSTQPCVEHPEMADLLILTLKEQCIARCAMLSPDTFMRMARLLLQKPSHPLIPTLISTLESLESQEALDLLNEQAERPGEPLIRHFSLLTLYRLEETPHREAQLVKLMREMAQVNCLQLRSPGPVKPLTPSKNLLTPEEESKLFLSGLETLASKREDHSIDLLFELLCKGNPKNRYAIAGLLIRAAQ